MHVLKNIKKSINIYPQVGTPLPKWDATPQNTHLNKYLIRDATPPPSLGRHLGRHSKWDAKLGRHSIAKLGRHSIHKKNKIIKNKIIKT